MDRNSTATMPQQSLGCTSMSARYGAELIVRDVSLDVPAGKITALIGPNGSGKSTLLQVLGRQLRAESGQVTLGGRDIADIYVEERNPLAANPAWA
ncbi:ABC transporter ATP-binding protein [Corynebacterium rouxii]|uniref:ABC transporter ATP-binding protein n=1 Tax=Corynebacterium rouxii TaxID=2719119 RepID=A0A6I8MGF4_9CORY|nr:ABC transporter ATP-binding protein [Corynebacterium rouxii]